MAGSTAVPVSCEQSPCWDTANRLRQTELAWKRFNSAQTGRGKISCKTASAWSTCNKCVDSSASLSHRGRALGAVSATLLLCWIFTIYRTQTETFFAVSLAQGWDLPGTGYPWAWGRTGPVYNCGAVRSGDTYQNTQGEPAGTALAMFGVFFPLFKYKLLESGRFFTECSYMHLGDKCILSLCFPCSKATTKNLSPEPVERELCLYPPGLGSFSLRRSSGAAREQLWNPSAKPLPCVHVRGGRLGNSHSFGTAHWDAEVGVTSIQV